MTHASATAFQVWSVLSIITSVFFVRHIYKFDRFECFKWSKNTSAQFTRFMIYSYTLSLPLITAYSLGFAIIKTIEGVEVADNGISFPKSVEHWTPGHRAWALPLYFFFSIGWALEITTHLEELCFWLFLVRSMGNQTKEWFDTVYFKIWATGSVLAAVLMVGSNIITRTDYLKCEAYTYLFGSICGLILTFGFFPIIYQFPAFLHRLRMEGVHTTVLARLRRNHEFNCIRVYFRFLFLVPLLIAAADGVRPSHSHIAHSEVWTDFLAIIAGLGCSVSSIMTLMIFFPRSIEAEMAREDPTPPPTPGNQEKKPMAVMSSMDDGEDMDGDTQTMNGTPPAQRVSMQPPPQNGPIINIHPPSMVEGDQDMETMRDLERQWNAIFQRRALSSMNLDGGQREAGIPLTASNLARHVEMDSRARRFRSPIGI